MLVGARLGDFTRRYPSISLTVLTGNETSICNVPESIWRSTLMMRRRATHSSLSDG